MAQCARKALLLPATVAWLSGAVVTAQPAPPAFETIDQGTAWTATARADFYVGDQGSRLIPLRWIAALKQDNGQPFLETSLSRYGYLPNPENPVAGVPVGFTVASGPGGPTLGMTCAACHTRQIEVAGKSYRIDGGPAIVDFQSLLADLDTAVGKVAVAGAAFDEFAVALLGPTPPPAEKNALLADVQAWYVPYHAIISRGLPAQPWGPARLDAVSMIFNRLAGVDIGPPPDYLLPNNIARADAPVRYPFLWNAPRQDKTQWPGFADNGNAILGLSRNLGEVYGVFATFHPKKAAWWHLGIDYLAENSANFSGLRALEELVEKIGPPRWPWPVDAALAEQGKAIFNRTGESGCVACHGITPGKVRFFDKRTWATPVQDVGTDSKQYSILSRRVGTGVLNGAGIPFVAKKLGEEDSALNVLRTAVVGAILQHYLPVLAPEMRGTARVAAIDTTTTSTPATNDLRGAFRNPGGPEAMAAGVGGPFAYESRVLEGIWATAPYLHNGSVPTLAALLTPAKDRKAEFAIGPAYDVENVGLAPVQTKFGYTLKTTDCSDRASGNSRCGHEFGTTLSDAEKRALLEYLKTL